MQSWDEIKQMLDSANETDHDTNLSHFKLREILDGKGAYSDNDMNGGHILIISLSILALFINCLTLASICYIRRRLSANQTMMLSLCCADLLSAVGILAVVVSQNSFPINSVTSPRKHRYAAICVYKIVTAVRLTGHNATLFNLLCLAVDHYCAIAKPLTYSLYMSKRRVHAILSIFWTISVIFGFSDFLMPSALHEHCQDRQLQGRYCEWVFCSVYEPEHLMFCVVLVCLTVMTIAYGCIMYILHSYQRHGYSTAPQHKVRRHIRGLVTSFIILGLFAVLWLPSCIMDASTILRITFNTDIIAVRSHDNVMLYLEALVILNAVCDPIVYAMRMREIQASLISLLRFKRPTFVNKKNGFAESLRNRSSNGSIPMRYVQRQYSTNSTNTNTTVYSGVSGNSMNSDKTGFSRKGTITSQASDLMEDTPLNVNVSMAPFEVGQMSS